MTSMTSTRAVVTVGVDTHSDTHHAAVIDEVGRPLADAGFPTTPAGYRQLLDWAREHGQITALGVEDTGAYGAALARHLRAAGETVIEVDRPDRRTRRQRGKSDPIDAYAAAAAVLSGAASGTPKTRDGLLLATCRRLRSSERPTDAADPVIAAAKLTLRRLARRIAAHSDAAFAQLCGTAPLPASSGRTTRHRLNRGGDRHANNALHTIALVRLSSHPPTKAYAARRRAEGLSNLEILRCLKRYIAREIHHVLIARRGIGASQRSWPQVRAQPM